MRAENKDRLALRMNSATKQKIEQWYAADNCRSKNEFVEKAVNFYADYLAAGFCTTLPKSIVSAIDGRLSVFEDRMARLLYKQSVEMDIGNGICNAHFGTRHPCTVFSQVAASPAASTGSWRRSRPTPSTRMKNRRQKKYL